MTTTDQERLERLTSPDRPRDVYAIFTEEVDALTILADEPVAKVVGDLTRAVKRAQMVYDGDLAPVAERKATT